MQPCVEPMHDFPLEEWMRCTGSGRKMYGSSPDIAMASVGRPINWWISPGGCFPLPDDRRFGHSPNGSGSL